MKKSASCFDAGGGNPAALIQMNSAAQIARPIAIPVSRNRRANPTKLPTSGPHGMYATPPGNQRDRGPEEYYESEPHELPEGASLQRTDEALKQVEAIVSETKGVRSAVGLAGMNILNSLNFPNAALMFVGLEPWEERKAPELHASVAG